VEKPSPRADLAWSAAWLALSTAILVASWTMDRLERLGAKLYGAPGLVPGLLGLVLLVLSLALAVRAVRQGARQGALRRGRPFILDQTWMGTALVLALCFGYAAGLIGRVPFWLATFVFVTAFIAMFEYPARRRMALAPAYAAATSLVVTWLFESVFLVRLP
jgi:hypothetical protein